MTFMKRKHTDRKHWTMRIGSNDALPEVAHLTRFTDANGTSRKNQRDNGNCCSVDCIRTVGLDSGASGKRWREGEGRKREGGKRDVSPRPHPLRRRFPVVKPVRHPPLRKLLSQTESLISVYEVTFTECGVNPFTPKSDKFQISPAASPEILHHTAWRTGLWRKGADLVVRPA